MAIGIFMLQGCTKNLLGPTQSIPVTSSPPGAKIVIDGTEKGATPLSLNLARNKGHVIRIEKEGYNPLTIHVGRTASAMIGLDYLMIFPGGPILGAYLGNLVGGKESGPGEFLGGALLGLVLGIVNYSIDRKAGAHYALSPGRLQVTLTKIDGQVRTQVVHLEAAQLRDIRWIRIKCSDDNTIGLINLR